MDKARSKCRDICFRSEKNQKVVCVHSTMAREYARVLEQNPEVVSYEAYYVCWIWSATSLLTRWISERTIFM